MAELLRVDGTTCKVYPADLVEGFSLEELRALTGCETVDIRRIKRLDSQGTHVLEWMVVDDDGFRNEKEINHAATLRSGYDLIVGDALFCSDLEVQ